MKNPKLPKFLTTHNPLLGNNTIYVIHTQSPAFIAEALLVDSVQLLSLQKEKFFTFNNKKYSLGTQTRVNGQLWALFVVRFFDDPENHVSSREIGSGGLMPRMGDWFHAYMKDFQK